MKIRDLLYGLSDDDLEALLEYKRQMKQRRLEQEVSVLTKYGTLEPLQNVA